MLVCSVEDRSASGGKVYNLKNINIKPVVRITSFKHIFSIRYLDKAIAAATLGLRNVLNAGYPEYSG